MSKPRILNTTGINDISPELLDENSRIKLFDAEHYKKYSWEEFRMFCHDYARYGIPTTELIEFLREKIAGRNAIEIGAGAGDLGYHLNIKMTDNRQQENEDIALTYKLLGQPVIKYPDDVEKYDAIDAIKKYKPQVVISSWTTTYAPEEMLYPSNPFGIKEDMLLDMVDTYIFIGNDNVHGKKPILKKNHQEIFTSWLISRSGHPHENIIYIWDKDKL